jgi:hypothetical protein
MDTKKPQISRLDMAFLDAVLEMGSGYVLNFSDRTFAHFFADDLGVDIDAPQFAVNGGSKGKRLRTYLQSAPPERAAAALEALWKYRADMLSMFSKPEPLPQAQDRYHRIISELRAGASLAKTDGLEKFTHNETLHELIAAIERDVQANKPEAALDRLHTYCMKKFAHLLSLRGEQSNPNESLNSRAARYFNPIRKAGGMRPISEKIVKSTVDIFELFNGIRNNASFAHDSQLVDPHEARFIFEAVINLLRFVKSIEAKNFE